MITQPLNNYDILLIKPKQKIYHFSTQPELTRLMGKKDQMPSYAFALLTAMTPPNFTIKIVDERVEDIPLDYPADIVGFTTRTSTINRTYELADHFRKKGATIVMGGPYASFCIEEVLAHAHTVIKGEAEGLWQQFLKDFDKGTIKDVYERDTFPAFTANYVPRWDNIQYDKYLCLPVQASRGCPYGCDFCLCSKMFGTRVRLRSIDNVIEEIQSLPMKRIFFVDDNLTINKQYARELMVRLKPLEISWLCQSSIEIAEDTELLELMADAGCDNILIGFESLNKKSLEETRKFQNIDIDYTNAIDKIHAAGIQVFVSMIIGFDNDTVDDIDRIHEFTLAAGAPFVNLNMLCDSPGSDLYHRMVKENRHVAIPLEYHGGPYPYLKYKNMSLTRLLDRYMDVTLKMFSYDTILEKAKKLFSKASFTRRKKDTDLTFWKKSVLTAGLVFRHLVTGNRYKRNLFFYMMKLVIMKNVAVERAFIFLISMEGFNTDIAMWYAKKKYYMDIFGKFERK